MCVINININASTQAGTTISSASGRYRRNGETTWVNFSITNINAAKTPNITILGQYVLEVNVTNNIGNTSGWASSTFSVTNDCGVDPIDPDPIDPIEPIEPTSEEPCIRWKIDPFELPQGERIEVVYTACDGSRETISVGDSSTAYFCAQEVVSVDMITQTWTGSWTSWTFSNQYGVVESLQERCGLLEVEPDSPLGEDEFVEIGENACNYDGTYHYYALSPCDIQYSLLFVKSRYKLTVGRIYQPAGSGYVGKQGAIAYVDCNQQGIILITSNTEVSC
jgi:hypothetical protein